MILLLFDDILDSCSSVHPSIGILPFPENIYVLLHAVLKQINQI